MENDPTHAPPVRLTQYSHGAGCGCKISPAQLEVILQGTGTGPSDPRLLVGHGTRDDAAVYDIGGDRCLISTTDFFSPIVDDPFDFGRIAITNAISDVFAMGGTPLLAVAVLGWPVDKLAPEIARLVVEGGCQACRDVGIPLAGGHSIDAPEPFFGAAITGEVQRSQVKRNDTAQEGDLLYLTKPIGLGLLATAQKRGRLRPEHARIGTEIMIRPNSIGRDLGAWPEVHALTDVTGFGLLGHLWEMCAGSGLGAELVFDDLPRIPEAATYLAEGCYPDGAFRNWKSLGAHSSGAEGMERMMFLSDPQTSGGLLIACAPDARGRMEELLRNNGLPAFPIGKMVRAAPHVTVR